jgi:hypothetical protein
MCDNRGCTARSACYRYRARPKDQQTFHNHADAAGYCNAIVQVEPWMAARGLVRDWQIADAAHDLAERALVVNPTREDEKV